MASSSRDAANLEKEWSDDECIRIAAMDAFPLKVKDLEIQKNIISKYYDFYVSGKIETGLNVADLVFATISIMPIIFDGELKDQSIWPDYFFADKGTLFFLTPSDKVKAEINIIMKKNYANQNLEIESKKNYEEKVDNSKEAKLNMEKTINTSNKNSEIDKEKFYRSEEEELNMNFDKYINDAMTSSSENQKRRSQDSSYSLSDEKSDSDSENDTTFKSEESDEDKLHNVPSSYKNVNSSTTKIPAENIEMPKDVKWLSDKKLRTQRELKEYSAVTNAAFTSYVNKLLQSWGDEKCRVALKYFLGITALMVLRATTKSYKHINNLFRTNSIVDQVPCFQGHYSIPNKRFVKKCYKYFSKRNKDARFSTMFAKIVINSYLVDLQRKTKTSFNLNIFRYCVLTHTAFYGLGLVTMLQSIYRDYDIDYVVKTTLCDDTKESWRRLREFIVKYMRKTSKSRTHIWARLINGHYFKSLCYSQNYPLSVILAVFIEKTSNSNDVWKSQWVQRDSTLQMYKNLGLKMYERYKKLPNNPLGKDQPVSKPLVSSNRDKSDEMADIFSYKLFNYLNKVVDTFSDDLYNYLGLDELGDTFSDDGE